MRVTSYGQISDRIQVINSSDLSRSVHDAVQALDLFPVSNPKNSPKYSSENIIDNLISYKNQLYISKFSDIYVVYIQSPNTPVGNVPGEQYKESDWLVICTGLGVSKTTSHDIGPSTPKFFNRILHNLTWYFGIPHYPNSWKVWLYSAETGKMLESTSGGSPQGNYLAYTLPNQF